jgi:hypothetical protein
LWSPALDCRWRMTWPLEVSSGAVPVWAAKWCLVAEPADVADLAEECGRQHRPDAEQLRQAGVGLDDRGLVSTCGTTAQQLSASTSLLRAGGGCRVRKPSPETCRHSRHEPELNRRRDHDAGGEAVRVGPPTEHEGRHHGRDARSGPTPLPEAGEATTEHEAGRRPRHHHHDVPSFVQGAVPMPAARGRAVWCDTLRCHSPETSEPPARFGHHWSSARRAAWAWR